jgi:hypothetical protein
MAGLTPQNPIEPGFYAGPVLHERYQVLESIIRGRYVIYDLTMLVGDGWEDWKACYRQPGGTHHDRKDPITFGTVAEAEAMVAKIVADPTLWKRKPLAAPPAARQVGRRPSMASRCRELLLQHLSDDEIYETVVKEFPTFRRTSVGWYRKELFTS